jgi:hypothetical protein
MRDEGVTEHQASDDRLLALLSEASGIIDRICGWFFESRQLRYLLDGRGTPSIEPPAPPIRIGLIKIDGATFAIDDSNLFVIGAPVSNGFDAPRLTLRGAIFSRGEGNVVVDGLWGYTEDNGTPEGQTPLAIRRACMLLVLRWLPQLGDQDASNDARLRWRIIEEKTRDQSYKLDRPGSDFSLTGDPEIDALLLPYRRPPGLGAA